MNLTIRVVPIVIVLALLLSACGFADAAARPRTRTTTTKPVLPPAPEGVTILQDVTYLDASRAEKLDLYLPSTRPAGTRSPAILEIHGGGWVGGDKASAREFNIGTTLAKAGYVVASINYEMTEGRRWPTNLHDCKNAVRFLRANADKYGIDVENIGVTGGSAGGHLALMVAYTSGVQGLEPDAPYPGVSSAVKCVVNMYGITDVRARRETDKEGKAVGEPRKKSALLTKTIDEDPELWKLASPVTHVSKTSPPTLILHGTKDTTVNREQATDLAAKLKEHAVEHELVLLDGVGHSFTLQTWQRKPLPRDLRPLVVAFFDKHLK
jgi:acetyl esterase/lipase